MRRFILLCVLIFIFAYSNLFPCGGSCLKCHPNLNFKNPSQHKIIKSCIECHSQGCQKRDDDLFLDGKNNACGQDCFECHTTLPENKEHKVISECIKCHKTLNISHD